MTHISGRNGQMFLSADGADSLMSPVAVQLLSVFLSSNGNQRQHLEIQRIRPLVRPDGEELEYVVLGELGFGSETVESDLLRKRFRMNGVRCRADAAGRGDGEGRGNAKRNRFPLLMVKR